MCSPIAVIIISVMVVVLTLSVAVSAILLIVALKRKKKTELMLWVYHSLHDPWLRVHLHVWKVYCVLQEIDTMLQYIYMASIHWMPNFLAIFNEHSIKYIIYYITPLSFLSAHACIHIKHLPSWRSWRTPRSEYNSKICAHRAY